MFETFFESFEMKENLFLFSHFPSLLFWSVSSIQPSPPVFSLLPSLSWKPTGPTIIARPNPPSSPARPATSFRLFREAQQGWWPSRRPSGSSSLASALLSVICSVCMLIYRISVELWKFCLFTVQSFWCCWILSREKGEMVAQTVEKCNDLHIWSWSHCERAVISEDSCLQ